MDASRPQSQASSRTEPAEVPDVGRMEADLQAAMKLQASLFYAISLSISLQHFTAASNKLAVVVLAFCTVAGNAVEEGKLPCYS